jgi:crossover junction endodeoxyribonuclease RusA
VRTWRYTLPWPISVNAMYRAIPRGRHCASVISDRGRQYRESVAASLLEQSRPPDPVTTRLSVMVTLHAPTRRRYDLDNQMKALLDALQHASVFADDGQIDELHISRGAIRKGGSAEVVIVEMNEEI